MGWKPDRRQALRLLRFSMPCRVTSAIQIPGFATIAGLTPVPGFFRFRHHYCGSVLRHLWCRLHVRLLSMSEAEKKTQYLSDVDLILQPLPFRRRKNGNTWRHKIDDRNELWININLGKAVVNPSFGVMYLDFESMLSKGVRSVSGTMVMLSSVASPANGYLIDEGSRRVAQDLLEHGIPFLFRLSNRAFAIERLANATVKGLAGAVILGPNSFASATPCGGESHRRGL